MQVLSAEVPYEQRLAAARAGAHRGSAEVRRGLYVQRVREESRQKCESAF